MAKILFNLGAKYKDIAEYDLSLQELERALYIRDKIIEETDSIESKYIFFILSGNI